MKTPKLDEQIRKLKIFKDTDNLNQHEADTLAELLAVKGRVDSDTLPKVCKGCGSLSTKQIDKKYLACCPDSNYISMEEYCKKSIYPDYKG